MFSREETLAIKDIINDNFIEMSITYAHEYKRNPANLISTYRNNKSVRMACAFIVKSYKEIGAFEECKQTGKDFTKYAEKYYSGEDARVFAEFLLILYSIINE